MKKSLFVSDMAQLFYLEAAPVGGLMKAIRIASIGLAALFISACGSHSSSTNAWKIESNVDKMTDQKTTYAVDTAKSPITNSYGMTFSPQLILGCSGPGKEAGVLLNLGDVAVIGGDIVNNIHPANIRFDKNEPFKWNLSAADKGYLFNKPSEFLKKASTHDKLLLQFNTALLSKEITVDFDISGVKDVLNKLQCT